MEGDIFLFSVAFNCYSLKGEKHITREEIFQLLKSSVLKVCERKYFQRKYQREIVLLIAIG